MVLLIAAAHDPEMHIFEPNDTSKKIQKYKIRCMHDVRRW